MNSAVDIANMSLAQLGQGPITSFSDQDVTARLCAQFYPTVRDAVLEDHNWSFATVRVVLAPLAAAPAFQYTAAFALPPGTLRVLLVSSSASTNFVNPQDVTYAVEGGNILANRDVIYVKLLQRVESVGLFSPSFVDALACRLAAEICTAITNSRELTEQLYRTYGMKVGVAARADGMQGSSQRMPPGSLVTIR